MSSTARSGTAHGECALPPVTSGAPSSASLPPAAKEEAVLARAPKAMDGEGVQLTIDTGTDTFERAIAAVRAAYGHNIPAPVSDWPEGTT